MERFHGGFVLTVHRLFYHSTLGPRVIKKREKTSAEFGPARRVAFSLRTASRCAAAAAVLAASGAA